MKLLFVFATLLLTSFAHAVEKNQEAFNSETTVDAKLPDKVPHDWTLGPIGARGWYRTTNGHSHVARQIWVTAVATGSPADGILSKNDVILGVNGADFTDDARVQFANAITAAESANGTLRLLRSRAGKSGTVEIKLPVLGSYSDTAPYDCPKSKRILELGCAALAQRMASHNYTKRLDPIPRSLNALGLLASGNKAYLPLIEREAKWAADYTTDGYLSWYYGYVMTFLSEYVMVTGDTSVMPGLKRLALETARGQSGVGTWGHRFAAPGGNLHGYGAMNQPGLSLTIGMVLAREAGVSDPELDRAITKAAGFLRWWVNKGAIPYGDHLPYPAHEDNGKCAAGAVLFDLLGDREAADFFAKMSTAAYTERERGHTGNYFNYLWALPGVARCGPQAIGAYMKEQAWYYDFARGWDGAFQYQPSPEGAEEYRAYIGWDTSGSHLIAYALPLKTLRLTGRKPFITTSLNTAQAAEVIAAGRDFAFNDDPNRYDERSTEQLLAGLSSWSPFVRKRSAAALGKREGNFVPTLTKLLASNDANLRYGACEALGALGKRANAAAPQLRAAFKDPDPWLQCLAAEAIVYLGPAERTASVSDLLALTVGKNPADPRRHAAITASLALFTHYPGTRAPKSILEDSLNGVNRVQLYPALQTLLQHEDSIARSTAARTYKNLNEKDLVELLPHIVRAIERPAPSNEMFADGVRLSGLDLLSRLHIREGMALCVALIEPDRWGERNRSSECLAYLQRYGIHAKEMLPKLRELRAYLADVKKVPADNMKKFDERLAAIEASTETPTLVNLDDFKAPLAARSADTDTDKKTLRVFIFAGQSNMVGTHSNVEHIKRYPPFDGLDKPQPDVLFSYNLGRETKETSKGWIALQPTGTYFGPELSFGRQVAKETAAPIAIIKCAAGGTTLGEDWNPNQPGGFKLYPLSLELVRSSLAELDRKQVAYRIEGFMWHQGENDMFHKDFKPAYAQNLANFIANWRRDLKLPGLRFYIGELCTKTVWGMDNRENMHAIRTAQKAVAAADPLVDYVPTSHDAVEIGGDVGLHYHYGTLGQLEQGANYAAAYLRTIGKQPANERRLKAWPYEKDSPITLFVLAGHRNMEGERAFTQDLKSLTGHEALARDNDKIAFKYSLGSGFKTSQGWEPLGPAGFYDTFGPELSFGRALQSKLSGNIAIAKFTHSGSQMNDWTPQGTSAKDCNLYPAFIAFIKESIRELEAKGHAVELAGIFYHAGENDMTLNPYRRDAAKWLQSTVAQSRLDLALPSLKWHVSQQPPPDQKELNNIDITANLAALAVEDSAFIHLKAFDLPPQQEKLVITTEGVVRLGELLAQSYLGTE